MRTPKMKTRQRMPQKTLSGSGIPRMNAVSISNYRFSGHETFAFRYPWLPKALAGLKIDRCLFKDEEKAIVELGVGKNMVRSMRFWIETTGIVQPVGDGGLGPTPLGKLFFGDEGLDPFLEDIQTLWTMHWKISTQKDNPLFAWEFLLNRWQEPEISEQVVLSAFEREAQKLSKRLSAITLKQHFEVFLHTYLPTSGRKGDVLEDNLDCPLTEIGLLRLTGERDMGGRKREPIYAFCREDKPSIKSELFCWALNDFRNKRYPKEKTLSVRTIATGVGSPGQIFKIPEEDVIVRLGDIESVTEGAIRYQESAALPQVHFDRPVNDVALLKSAFKQRIVYV